MQRNLITQGSIPKGLLAFFFPIWMGTFFQQLYNTVDAVVVGNFVGKEALAAVGGPTAVIINLLVGFFVGLSSGASVVISQFYGAKDKENTQHSVHTAIALSFIGGAVMMLVGIAVSPTLLRWMDTPADVLGPSITYLRIYFCGMVFSFLYNIGSGVLRAVGDSKRPLYFLIVCSLCNVVLDIVFVVFIPMGVAGVALATVLSQAISAVLVFLSLELTSDLYKLNRHAIRIHWPILRKVVRIGLPAGMQAMMYSFSNLIIQSSINVFGTNAVAAWAAYGKIDGLFWMTIQSFGIAITTFSGQNFGARQYDRMRQSVRICLVLATAFTAVLTAVLLLGGPFFYRMFTNDTDVMQLGVEIIHYLVPFYFTYIAIEVLAGAMCGTGEAIVPMLLTCFGICVLRVVWIWVAVPLFPTLQTVYFSYPLTWSATSVLFILYYTKGGWLKRSQRKAGHMSLDAQ